MNKPHKWHREIKAWADGATIEMRRSGKTEWAFDLWVKTESPKWNSSAVEFRVKPEPTVVEWWLPIWMNNLAAPSIGEPRTERTSTSKPHHWLHYTIADGVASVEIVK